ncbi:MAG: RNA polymerase sigma factor [Tannerellaceae bacterium]|jgi:RNA polymerase sigma-70 factor (ECF subfamily)|nr:RNA polymerase sigma factor [Tannerellaceae bacterium]
MGQYSNKTGDSLALLLEKYSGAVYSLVFRLVRNSEDAEELVQDVFMKVFRHMDSFRGDSSLSTWIYKIAYHAAISRTRRQKREYLPVDEAMIENMSEDSLSAFASGDGPVRYLEAALDMLTVADRGMVLLFYMEDKSIDDIATITGLSVANVKVRLHRIRKKLFVIITQMEENEDE